MEPLKAEAPGAWSPGLARLRGWSLEPEGSMCGVGARPAWTHIGLMGVCPIANMVARVLTHCQGVSRMVMYL